MQVHMGVAVRQSKQGISGAVSIQTACEVKERGYKSAKGRSRIVLGWAGCDGESTDKGVGGIGPEVRLNIADISRWMGSSSVAKRRKTDMMEL